MKIHQEVLDNKRLSAFKSLAAFKKTGYLADGTALALQLGHRLSYDFDIFCAKPLSASLAAKVKASLPFKRVLINNSDELTVLTNEEIKISFIYYPFNLKNYLTGDNLPIKLLNIKGVALAKAYVLNRRNSWRDYLDLYYILKSERLTLMEIIAGAGKVYGELFSAKLFLTQLLYTQDIALAEIKQTRFLKNKVGLKEVKKYFTRQVDGYLSVNKNFQTRH